jgi:hypothetical protein
MKESSGFWEEWTSPYSLKIIKDGFFIGIFAGTSEGTIIYILMYALGMFDTLMLYGK